jgi:hypothetical protein
MTKKAVRENNFNRQYLICFLFVKLNNFFLKMLKKRIFEFLRNEVKTVTIEPIIFLNAFGISIVIGAQVKLGRKN